MHDFPDKELGKAIPYGVYDIGADKGFVNVGVTKETGAFAVASIRGWWEQLGRERYPDATTLQITADCGGGNGNLIKLWKVELQRLADDTGLEISTLSTTARSKPSRRAHTLSLRTSLPLFSISSLREAGNLGAARRAPFLSALRDPRKRQESHI